MDSLGAIRHQVAIAGQVADAQTSKSLSGARVEITAAPAEFNDFLKNYAIQFGKRWTSLAERPDRMNTRADGSFRFMDLPDGQYTLKVSLPGAGSRYGTAQATVNVTRNAQGKITRATANFLLPPTTVKGRIANQNGEALAMVEVRVKGSGERAFSDAQGQYLLAGLEAGTRTLLVSAQGFQPAAQNVTLAQAGVTQTVDVNLTKS